MTVYHILVGPFLAYLTTNNPNEWVAVWCLYSIGLLLLLLKTPIRDYLHHFMRAAHTETERVCT